MNTLLFTKYGLNEDEQRAFDAWLVNHFQNGYDIRADDRAGTVSVIDTQGNIVATHRIADFKSVAP